MPPHPVHEVLHERRRSGSLPGERTDGFRVALVIEGGGNRTAYSAGMALALDELGLTSTVDAIYGTSGGALNGAWLLTGEAQQWLPSWASPEVAANKITDPWRVLRGGTIVDTRLLVHHVYEQVTPMNFEAILANPISFHPIGTDVHTGQAHDLSAHITDRASLQTALRATICLPLLAGRPVPLGGRRWLDGGMAEGVPFRTAIADGATHLLVLRTRRTDQSSQPPAALERRLLAPYFLRHAPGVRDLHVTRHRSYAEEEAYLDQPDRDADDVQILQLRPPLGSPDVPRLSTDLDLIARALEIGRVTARETLDLRP